MEDQDEDEQRERNMRLWAARQQCDQRAAHGSDSETTAHGAPSPMTHRMDGAGAVDTGEHPKPPRSAAQKAQLAAQLAAARMECLSTLEEITMDNYCEYQTAPSMRWHPSLFAAEVIEHLLATQFQHYLENVQKADCAAALKRVVDKGPPVYLSDPHALPIAEGDTHIARLWFASDDTERSAKLKDAVDGEEREKLWAEHRMLIAAMEVDNHAQPT